MLKRDEDRAHEVVDVHEVPTHRDTLSVEHQRHGTGADIPIGALRADIVAPSRAPEDVLSEGQREAEVVFFLDPGCPQAAAGKVVLDVVLLQHHLFQHLGQRVGARVRRVAMLLGDGQRMGHEEMPDAGVAADEHEPLERRARTGGLEQPEQPFHGDIHDQIGRLLDGRQMQDVGHPIHRLVDRRSIGDGPGEHLDAIARLERPVVAQGAHRPSIEPRVRQEACDERPADLAGRARDQDPSRLRHHHLPAGPMIPPRDIRWGWCAS